jgi:hypothetical protein
MTGLNADRRRVSAFQSDFAAACAATAAQCWIKHPNPDLQPWGEQHRRSVAKCHLITLSGFR